MFRLRCWCSRCCSTQQQVCVCKNVCRTVCVEEGLKRGGRRWGVSRHVPHGCFTPHTLVCPSRTGVFSHTHHPDLPAEYFYTKVQHLNWWVSVCDCLVVWCLRGGFMVVWMCCVCLCVSPPLTLSHFLLSLSHKQQAITQPSLSHTQDVGVYCSRHPSRQSALAGGSSGQGAPAHTYTKVHD